MDVTIDTVRPSFVAFCCSSWKKLGPVPAQVGSSKSCQISSINGINHVEGVNHSDFRFLPANGTNDPGQKEDWFVRANFIRSCDLPSHYEFPVAQSLGWFGLCYLIGGPIMESFWTSHQFSMAIWKHQSCHD